MLIYTDYSLKDCNTFSINAKADVFVEITSAQDIETILKRKKYSELLRLILGNGSNMLFTKDFKGIVLKNAIKGISTITETDDCIIIKVCSGENFDDVCAYCAKNRYFGPEFLSGIPGQLGGAVVQNIGAYGHELSMFVQEVEYYNLDTYEVNKINAADCKFGYRQSIFKTELSDAAFILSATLKLAKGKYNPDISYGNLKDKLTDKPILTPIMVRKAVIDTRDEKIPNPKEFGNAGSFYKNPEITESAAKKLKDKFPEVKQFNQPNGLVKIPAGQLIDLCGFKQIPDPKVGVAPSNALIMINLGGATGKDVVAYSKKIQKAVKEKFGVKIEPEVVIC